MKFEHTEPVRGRRRRELLEAAAGEARQHVETRGTPVEDTVPTVALESVAPLVAEPDLAVLPEPVADPSPEPSPELLPEDEPLESGIVLLPTVSGQPDFLGEHVDSYGLEVNYGDVVKVRVLLPASRLAAFQARARAYISRLWGLG